jgi:hypothetical protein
MSNISGEPIRLTAGGAFPVSIVAPKKEATGIRPGGFSEVLNAISGQVSFIASEDGFGPGSEDRDVVRNACAQDWRGDHHADGKNKDSHYRNSFPDCCTCRSKLWRIQRRNARGAVTFAY